MSSSSDYREEVSRIKELQNSGISVISDGLTFYWSTADEVTRRKSISSFNQGGKEGSVGRDVCSYRREKLDELKLCSLKFLYEIEGKIMSETERNGRRKGDLRKVIKM